MGIYDRDWMRRRNDDSPAPFLPLQLPGPRKILQWCGILLALIMLGVYFSPRVTRQTKADQKINGDEPQSIPPMADRTTLAPATKPTHRTPRPVNVNKATPEELKRIPGMREDVALAIARMGPYEKLEDLMRVPGIKKARLELLRPYITVGK